MKIILGDNQFFGINHFDLEKGATTKLKFDKIKKKFPAKNKLYIRNIGSTLVSQFVDSTFHLQTY